MAAGPPRNDARSRAPVPNPLHPCICFISGFKRHLGRGAACHAALLHFPIDLPCCHAPPPQPFAVCQRFLRLRLESAGPLRQACRQGRVGVGGEARDLVLQEGTPREKRHREHMGLRVRALHPRCDELWGALGALGSCGFCLLCWVSAGPQSQLRRWEGPGRGRPRAQPHLRSEKEPTKCATLPLFTGFHGCPGQDAPFKQGLSHQDLRPQKKRCGCVLLWRGELASPGHSGWGGKASPSSTCSPAAVSSLSRGPFFGGFAWSRSRRLQAASDGTADPGLRLLKSQRPPVLPRLRTSRRPPKRASSELSLRDAFNQVKKA